MERDPLHDISRSQGRITLSTHKPQYSTCNAKCNRCWRYRKNKRKYITDEKTSICDEPNGLYTYEISSHCTGGGDYHSDGKLFTLGARGQRQLPGGETVVSNRLIKRKAVTSRNVFKWFTKAADMPSKRTMRRLS